MFSELIDEAQEFLSNLHHHISDIILPPTKVMDSICVILYRFLGLFAHSIKLLKWPYIAPIDVLHVIFVNEAWQTLEPLLFTREKVQPAAVDRASLSEAGRRAIIIRSLHHVFNYA